MKNVTTRTVWNWIRRGELQTRRTVTGRVRIVFDDNHMIALLVSKG